MASAVPGPLVIERVAVVSNLRAEPGAAGEPQIRADLEVIAEQAEYRIVVQVAPGVAAEPPPQIANVPSNGAMNEYLIAHQEYSPSTAIQGLAPYIRAVSGAHSAAGR